MAWDGQIFFQLLAMVITGAATAGGIYGAIRSRLDALTRDVARHEQAIARAHERIDHALER